MNSKRQAVLRAVWLVGLIVCSSAAFRLLGSGDTAWGVGLLAGVAAVAAWGVWSELRAAS